MKAAFTGADRPDITNTDYTNVRELFNTFTQVKRGF